MIEFPANPFWDYSVRLYADAEVAGACLRLQERHGVDVNLVLLCLWAAASGRGSLAGQALARALDAAEIWHREVVRHLRALRKRLKGDAAGAPRALAEGLRRAVAATEIDAEHVEQILLAASLSEPGSERESPATRARQAAAGLGAYLRAIAAEVGEADHADAALLLGAAFPEVPRSLIDSLARFDQRS